MANGNEFSTNFPICTNHLSLQEVGVTTFMHIHKLVDIQVFHNVKSQTRNVLLFSAYISTSALPNAVYLVYSARSQWSAVKTLEILLSSAINPFGIDEAHARNELHACVENAQSERPNYE